MYFSLEVHMHMQLLQSPLRVLSPEEADIVYALCSKADFSSNPYLLCLCTNGLAASLAEAPPFLKQIVTYAGMFLFTPRSCTMMCGAGPLTTTRHYCAKYDQRAFASRTGRSQHKMR